MADSDLIFVGGIDGKKKWLDDGKSFSRNYKQGNRIYDSEGVATALSAQPVGGTGGYTSLYLTKGSDSMSEYNEPLTKSDVQHDFTFAELFAGIGGVSFGFESVGGKCVLAAEYDPTAEGKRQFAQDAYKALHPETPVVGDVFKLDAKDVPDCDVLSFTTPCQSFSVAGKRLGFEDTRGTLVFEALRIAKEKRPKALFMENVKGLVNHDKGRTIDTILHAMNEVGYTVDFNVLNSKYFGVPQNRERVFIIGIRDDLIDPSEWNPEGNTMLPKAKRRLKDAGLRTFNFDWPEQENVTKRLRDVLEAQVDEKYYLSDDKTAKLVAELETNTKHFNSDVHMVGRADIPGHDYNKRIYGTDGVSRTLNTASDIGRSVKIAEPTTRKIAGLYGKRQAGSMWDVDGLSPTIKTSSGGYSEPLIEEINGLPIREATTKGYAVAAEGDAVNIQFPNSTTRRGRVGQQMANTLEASGCNQGVVVSDKPIMLGHLEMNGHDLLKRVYSEEGQAPTLTTMGGGNTEPKTAINKGGSYRIRKLTPRECMRLQGFPESATDTLYGEGFSDSRIYKFAGNAVTTTVIKALGERLAPYLGERVTK